MDRHKKFNGPNRRSASIDGFVSNGRIIGGATSNSYSPMKPVRVAQTSSIGAGARRVDGFYPSRTTPQGLNKMPEAEEAALLDEPIILDDSGTKKKKRYYFVSAHPTARKLIKRSALTLIALILIGAAYLGAKAFMTERHLFHGGGGAPALSDNVDISQLKGEGDGRINILLLGVGGPGHDGPDLTDTIMVASIDPVNNKVALLSIPRDLWVKIPGNGYQKINAAYPDGKSESRAKTLAGKEQDGLNLLDRTISPVIGIPIHYHVVVDFSAFKDVVDALGGVNINVTSEVYDPTIEWENNWNPVIAKPGPQVMHGQQALLFARSRETSSDFSRAERQRQLLVAIKDKALSAGTFSNPIKISNLLSGFGNNVYTDFSLNDMTRLYKITQRIPSKEISSIDLVTAPHNYLTTGNMNGLSIVEPKAGLFQYGDITNYIRNTLRDGFLAKENAKVTVYNATDKVGLANSKASLLKSYGYTVTTVGNTATVTNQATTTVVDLTKGKDKYTRHYLEERFGVTAKTSIPSGSGINPPQGTDFVIILGEDAATSSQN
ncbi:MAG TPA: LCP family protein [Candidatus Saccharimonadales bacterium]|nr:LCP family protein [Candidatus Saccharimonadales bacterium]